MKKLFLLSILTSGSYAQSCLSLQGSKACPALQQYYISTQNFNFLSNVTTITQFDDALMNYVSTPDLYFNQLGCDNNDNIPYARYSLTYLCESLLQDSDYSLPCNYNLNLSPPPLCQFTCFQYIQSVDQHTTTCSSQSAHQQQIDFLNQTCQTWSGLNGTGNCILGIANEPDNCGFSSKSDACQYCKTNQQDNCCDNVKQCQLLSSGAIAGIVIGIIAFLALMLLSLIYYRRKKRSKYQKESNVSYASMGSQRVLSGVAEPPIKRNDEEEGELEEFYEVRHAYPAQMSDELGLCVGDIVCVAMHFDDGWALGFNVTTGSKGVFPVVCVSPVPHDALEQLLHHPPDLPQELSTKTLIEEDQLPLNPGPIPRRTASIRYQEKDVVESLDFSQRNSKRVSKLQEN